RTRSIRVLGGDGGGEPGRNEGTPEVAFSPIVDLPPDLPPGLYERLVTERLRERLSALDARLVVRGPLDPDDADPVLVRTVGEALGRALRGIRGDGQERLAAQIALCNDVVAQLARSVPQAFDGPGDQVATPHEILLAPLVPPDPPAHPRPLPRREIPLSQAALLVNGRDQPRIGAEVAREMESADSVDLLSAFIKLQGLRTIERPLRAMR